MNIFKKLLLVALVLVGFVVSCNEDDSCNCYTACGDEVVISNVLYAQDPSSLYTILDVGVTGDCLAILVSSSGCDGDSWTTELLSAEPVTTATVSANVRMDLVNMEACLAVISKEFMFDLTPLQVAGENSVIINLDGWDTSLVYNY